MDGMNFFRVNSYWAYNWGPISLGRSLLKWATVLVNGLGKIGITAEPLDVAQ